MKIKKFRKGVNIFVRAADRESKFLFEHCANGESMVTTRFYNKHVEPLLFIHGVTIIETVDET